MYNIKRISDCETNSYWQTALEALKVWKDRPNVVNRRLCGCSETWRNELKLEEVEENLEDVLIFPVIKEVGTLCPKFIDEASGINQKLKTVLINVTKMFELCESTNDYHQHHYDDGSRCDNRMIKVSIRKLLPRSLKKFKITVEMVASFHSFSVAGNLLCSATWFVPLFMLSDGALDGHSLANFSYCLKYEQQEMKKGRFQLLTTDRFSIGSIPAGTLCANLEWLKETLLPKLKNWSECFKVEDHNSGAQKLHSLSLINVETYSKIYNEMKEKYAQALIESWNENTDPQKFIFEDISIASYLLVLWEDEQKMHGLKKKQSFIDLGCGNGLLVYLLTKEGYKGCGIDIRRRKIWEQFGEETKLLEQPLHPNCCKFDDVDWIIGNHSDELTPWIPVITARSSYTSKYFLLPCCFHDFTGKFKQNCHDSSQYQSYLDFVSQIGKDCGFVIEHDIQRIPSTKRTCHVARKRTYAEVEHETIDNRIQEVLVAKNCRLKLDTELTQNEAERLEQPTGQHYSIGSCAEKDSEQYQPRMAQEKVRNCTQIDKHLKDSIVRTVFNALLQVENRCLCGEVGDTSTGVPISKWNCGGTLTMQEVTKLVEKESLLKLKSQCGGLQTLLKNHGHIFQVIKGEVSLRNFKKIKEAPNHRKKKSLKTGPNRNYKTKRCWFHHHHPEGCVLSDAYCNFAHSDIDTVVI